MSATSSTADRRSGPLRRSARKGRPRWLVPVIVVGLVGAGLFMWLRPTARTATITTATVSRGTLTAVVSGSGTVQPARALDLSFLVSGQVVEVLVAAGDMVKAEQPLVRLDPRDLELQVQQAEASLRSAEAKLAQAQGEGATAIDIRQAELSLRNAEIQLAKTEQGNATAADLRSAQANLASAQARLTALTDPSAEALSAAETRVGQAQASLQNTRDSDSASKTRAQLDLDKAVQALTQAQSRYATAKENWEYVQSSGNDPVQPEQTTSTGTSPNKLTDGQMQQYYDTYIQAEASLRTAEAAVEQSRISYDSARQKEQIDVAQAEQTLRDAQIQLEALRSPTATDLAQAKASVTQAQSQLDNLRSGGTTRDIEAAQVQVAQAQLALEKLTAPASESELAAAEASVIQARVQLENAKLDLERATLSAPFDGMVSSVSVVVGQLISGSGTAAASVIDRSSLHLNLSLSESDTSRIAVGQPVTLSFDALSGQTVSGTVAAIAPVATVQQNVVTYQVTVNFDPGNAPVKVGMSATGDIQVDQRSNVLIAPSRAIQTQGGTQVIQVRTAADKPTVSVQVETGLVSDGQTEIVSCAETGSQCLQEGDVLVVTSAATTQRTTTQGGFGSPGSGPGFITR